MKTILSEAILNGTASSTPYFSGAILVWGETISPRLHES